MTFLELNSALLLETMVIITILLLLFDLGTGDRTQDLVHARQVLYH